MNDPEANIFTPGITYSPKFDFSRLGSHFVAGERLVFKRSAYSRYDDVYCHEFIPPNDGSVKSWFLVKGETPEDWVKYFTVVPAHPQFPGSTNAVSALQGLSANFLQTDGTSRPGIDWMIAVNGARNARVIVRVYLPKPNVTEDEKAILAQKAVGFIQSKIAGGWEPSGRDGILELPAD